MRKTYKKPNIYKVSMGSECMTPVVLSKQSIGEDVDPIGGGGKVDDEGDAKFFYHSLWDEDLWDEE
ncbi:MAG: hypothetical protein IKH22_08080 [Prevotella sp.]|nr:hypothetical protein [Prevotella sp.]